MRLLKGWPCVGDSNGGDRRQRNQHRQAEHIQRAQTGVPQRPAPDSGRRRSPGRKHAAGRDRSRTLAAMSLTSLRDLHVKTLLAAWYNAVRTRYIVTLRHEEHYGSKFKVQTCFYLYSYGWRG